MSYKVGDRVQVNKGKLGTFDGTVVEVRNNWGYYDVKFDAEIGTEEEDKPWCEHENYMRGLNV